ncbi:MAG: helix-turn-helix domain-containing protein [Pyrinomonadaceae bacterium]
MSTQIFSVSAPNSKLDLSRTQKLPKFLTVQEVADLLRCKKRTIYDMVEQKRIPYRKVGGRLLFDLAEIIEWTKRG